MDACEIIEYIRSSKKTTPVKIYLREVADSSVGTDSIPFPGSAKVFPTGAGTTIIFGDWKELAPVIEENRHRIADMVVENEACNSAIPLLDKRNIHARIEPGAIIREQVEIGANSVIMMGAVINIGAVIGENTMIDMGVVLGGRAIIGKRCHIGAGAVIAGVVEPPSATPVIVEDDVLVGANAVVIEGVHIGRGAVVAAGSVVLEDVPCNTMVAGIPARIVKIKDEKTERGTELIDALREL